METGFQFRENAAMTHAFDALTLVAFRHVGSNKRKWHRIEFSVQHRIHVVHEFTGDRILVSRDSDFECAHRPLDRRPMQRRKTGPYAKRTLTELVRRGRENGR